MSTAEDVFYLYERNSSHYHNCNKIDRLEICEECASDGCYCHLKQDVYPFTIGDQQLPCNIKVRCYIRPGDECPVCYEEILTKSSAYITCCGHHFHKKCFLVGLVSCFYCILF